MIQTVPQGLIDTLKANTPLGRLGEAEDIANAYAFLSSETASFITGTTINVDGGLVM
jgi:3-oxoacyl-[acyl-carrier protein] reductase